MNLKVFYQELGKKIKAVRKTAGLTQEQVAKGIGLTRQYIIQIEKGKAKNPTLGVILDYLDVCNVRWTDFFAELKHRIDKINYDQVINEVGLSSATGLTFRQKRKVDRDISYYRMRIDSRKGKAKTLSERQKHRAAVKFGKYRVTIEPIEAEVQKKFGELNVPIAQNLAYKDFTRECCKALKKAPFDYTDSKKITPIDEIIKRWQAQGLKEEVLLTIKDIVVRHFKPFGIDKI